MAIKKMIFYTLYKINKKNNDLIFVNNFDKIEDIKKELEKRTQELNEEEEEHPKLSFEYLRKCMSKKTKIHGLYVIASDKMTMNEYNTMTR